MVRRNRYVLVTKRDGLLPFTQAMTYPFTQESENEYLFISKGPRGSIRKCVTFQALDKGIYNLLLESELDGVRQGDTERTNNGDVFRIVNTVVEIIKEDLRSHPTRVVYIRGSDDQRGIAYQRRALVGEPLLNVLGQTAEDGAFERLEIDKRCIAPLAFLA